MGICELFETIFDETKYDGRAFLDACGDTQIKGFGLQMMKAVCNEYGLKSGPYSKAKKQCNDWAHKIYQRSQGVAQPPPQVQAKVVMEESKQKEKPKPIYSGNWSKFVTQIPADYDDPFAGKSWFWFNDFGGYKWIPYREVDVKKLNKAWTKKNKACLIVNGAYRVDFDFKNQKTPCGHQYNTKQINGGGRTVICAKSSAKQIHGIDVSKQPL
eukprot:12730_1